MDNILYETARILTCVSAKKGSLRSLVFASKYSGVSFDTERRRRMAQGSSVSDKLSGTRFLENPDKVFEQNAWDQVDWDQQQLEDAKAKVSQQEKSQISQEKATDLQQNAHEYWDKFYARHENKFFKDRNWLFNEFPELNSGADDSSEPFRLLEVGCGAGNTVFPILETISNRRIMLYCCDFSSNAVQIVKEHAAYDETKCQAFVWDITESNDSLPIADSSLDCISAIFVFSALHPSKMRQALSNLVRLLKPGGLLLFRDYGKYDLAQLRFKSGSCISESLYTRGDGTMVYFFTEQEIDDLFCEAGLEKQMCVTDKRLIVNRGKRIKMFRVWLQNKKLLLRLCCETLKHRQKLDKIIESPLGAELLSEEIYSGDRSLVLVLLYEFIFGAHGLKCSKRLAAPIKRRSEQLQQKKDELFETGGSLDGEVETVRLPRYARVNLLKTDMRTVLESLENEQFELIDSSEAKSRREFRTVIFNLENKQFCVDKDIPYVLVFAADTDLHKNVLVSNGCLILQDKASCLPAFCLNPTPGSYVMESCAAPGMKTSQLAACIKNKGCIFAFDKNRDRVKTLRMLTAKHGVNCVTIECADFLRIDTSHKRFQKAMLLKTALGLPALKRLIYSTCSISVRENEAVIQEIVSNEQLNQQFALVDPLPSWKHRGKRGYAFSKLCLRASPEKDGTNGFFIAMFERRNK